MLCNFHFIWVFSMKIIKKLILGAPLAETWLLCLRNLCWALQKVDKHETLEAWKKWMLIPGVGFSPFCNSTKFPNNFVYPRFSKLENFFNHNEFHFSVIFFLRFTRKEKSEKTEAERGKKTQETRNFQCYPSENAGKFYFTSAKQARQGRHNGGNFLVTRNLKLESKGNTAEEE